MHAYVIKLIGSSDRRAYITAQLGKTQLNYEIVNAVDGRDLDLSDTRVVDQVFAATSVAQSHPGVVGCALSHVEVYRRILDDGLEIACVLEDDVVLPTDLGILTDALTRHMRGAEVVLLNFQSPEPCRVTKDGAVQLPASRLLVKVAAEGQAASAGDYSITRDARVRLVNAMLHDRPVADY